MKDVEKEELNSTTHLVLIFIAVVLFILLIYIIKNNSQNNNKIETNTTNEPEQINTNTKLSNYLNNAKKPISSIVLKEATVQKNQTNELLVLKKNVNYFVTNENKQLYTMEYILKDEFNNQKFIVLENKKEIKTKKPTDNKVLAYCSYELFSQIYKNLFNIEFDLKTKKISKENNKYDKSDKYVFYNKTENKYPNLAIENFEVESTSYNNTSSIYTANITIKYNSLMANKLGVPSDYATVEYSLVDGNIVMKSFIIK